ncbi:hypothetical protein D082_12810 [Synechocystis sp. PCC 6714]|nr:hypothetical protein D082_12810 [Synechocystis sp. PCC 6714]
MPDKFTKTYNWSSPSIFIKSLANFCKRWQIGNIVNQSKIEMTKVFTEDAFSSS